MRALPRWRLSLAGVIFLVWAVVMVLLLVSNLRATPESPAPIPLW